MQHTPGPWTAYVMRHADTRAPLTPEQIGEYVCNSVRKSAEASGTLDFLFVSTEKPDGPADVCHVGNGPTSPANACLIAAAPEMFDALKNFVDSAVTDSDTCALCGSDWPRHVSGCAVVVALYAMAKATTTGEPASPPRCDHKFVDSTACLKCGWTPPPPEDPRRV